MEKIKRTEKIKLFTKTVLFFSGVNIGMMIKSLLSGESLPWHLWFVYGFIAACAVYYFFEED